MKHKVKHDVEFEWKNRTVKVHGQPHGQGERDTVSLCNSDIWGEKIEIENERIV